MTSSNRGVLRREAIRRLVGALLVVWAALTAAFFAVRLMPGSVEAVILGVHLNDPGLREQVRASLGLDRPVFVQYAEFMWNTVRGDFGRSYLLRADVGEVIGSQLGPTLQLAGATVLVSLAATWVIIVTTTGVRPRAERLVRSGELIAICLPTFWVGTMLIALFAFQWRLLPSSGATGWQSLVLPVVTLALPVTGVLSQFAREEVARQLDQPFVVSARSRGISEFRLRAVHLVPHAAVTCLTVAGNMLGVLIGGAVIVETVFGRPGIGRVALNAVESHDTPVVIAVVVVVTVAYVLVTAIVDLVAVLIDPRLRAQAVVA